LDQSGKHHTDTEEIADIGEMNVEIPANGIDVIEYSETCNAAYKSERAINSLEN
jgi:hypothetical protein